MPSKEPPLLSYWWRIIPTIGSSQAGIKRSTYSNQIYIAIEGNHNLQYMGSHKVYCHYITVNSILITRLPFRFDSFLPFPFDFFLNIFGVLNPYPSFSRIPLSTSSSFKLSRLLPSQAKTSEFNRYTIDSRRSYITTNGHKSFCRRTERLRPTTGESDQP